MRMRTTSMPRKAVRHALVGAAALFAVTAFSPSPAAAKTPTQSAFHEAFIRMDARWPNISSHDYFIALRDAELSEGRLTAWERDSDEDIRRDLRVLQVYRNCWLALIAKERALSEMAIGQILIEQEHKADAAREHLALAVAEWNHAIKLWPYLTRERVVAASTDGRSHLAATGAVWRAKTQQLLFSLR